MTPSWSRLLAARLGVENVIAERKPRHRHQELLAFLKQVAKTYPDDELHRADLPTERCTQTRLRS